MMKWWFLVLVAMLLGVPAHSAPLRQEQGDCAGCTDPPLFSRLPGFHITRAQELELGRYDFPVDLNQVKPLQGRYHQVDYGANAGSRVPTGSQILRQMERMARAMGGNVVYRAQEGEPDQITLKVARGRSEVWASVSVATPGTYQVTVVEVRVMGLAGTALGTATPQPLAAHPVPGLEILVPSAVQTQAHRWVAVTAQVKGAKPGSAATWLWTQTAGPQATTPGASEMPAVPLRPEDLTHPALRFFPVEPGTYAFTVTVTSGQDHASATVSVSVVPPPLVAKVSPSQVTAAAGSRLVLTASPVGGMPGATVTYAWHLLTGGLALSPTGGWNSPVLDIPAGQLSPEGNYTFSVTISQAQWQLKASATAAVQVVSMPPITVQIIPSTPHPRATSTLMLLAKPLEPPPAGLTYSFLWKQTAGEALVLPNGWTQNTLVIPANTLKAGLSYAFQVTVQAGSAVGEASIQVVPQP